MVNKAEALKKKFIKVCYGRPSSKSFGLLIGRKCTVLLSNKKIDPIQTRIKKYRG